MHRRSPGFGLVGFGAQCALRLGILVTACYSLQAQHLLSGTRSQGDSIRARGRLQGLERVVRIDVCQVGHALLFDQIAYSGEHLHEPRDDLVEQALNVFI